MCKKNNLIIVFILYSLYAAAQSNTAFTSGSIGKCKVWSYPYTLYNNSGATQTINDGITVTVDQNRNIGAFNLSGSGAMSMNGTNGITLSGSGGQINCRWDIAAGGSYSVVNNNGVLASNGPGYNLGAFFTAPYSGNYFWALGSGWSATVSGAYLNAGIQIRNDGNGLDASFFFQNQTGSCGTMGAGGQPAQWSNGFGPISIAAGQTLSYTAGTAYTNAPGCTNTTLNFMRGSATVYFDN